MEASAYSREVGHRLPRKRQMLGVSQGTLAARVPMPQSRLSRLERRAFHHVDVGNCGSSVRPLDHAGFSAGV